MNNKEVLIAVSQSEKLYFQPSIKSGVGGSEQLPNKQPQQQKFIWLL